MVYNIDGLNLDARRVLYGFFDNTLDFSPENKAARKGLLEYIYNNFNKKGLYINEIKQIHGNDITILDKNFMAKGATIHANSNLADADGVFTQETGIVLCVRTADCIPVLFYDTNYNIAGAVHCGWRGTLGDIIINAKNILINNFKSNLNNVVIMLGPSICKNCYEVKEDLLNEFISKNEINRRFFEPKTGDNRLFFDLKGLLKNELYIAGFKKENIYDLNKCNFKDKKFYSFRRDKSDKRQVSFIVNL